MSTTTPVFGVAEWAAHSWNIASGCAHDCRYCYAKAMAVRFGRATPESWRHETVLPSKLAKRWRKVEGRIMYPTTHDITPGLLESSVATLRSMLATGNEVLVVSKPHLECVERLCAELRPWRERVMWRMTIGSLSRDCLGFWEPGAPESAERIAALRHAHASGYRTSVSSEPMLDDASVALVRAVRPFVTDSIWIGKANNLLARLRFNGADESVLAHGRALLTQQCDANIRTLYRALRCDPLVRWKESIKKVVGLDVATVAGLDV